MLRHMPQGGLRHLRSIQERALATSQRDLPITRLTLPGGRLLSANLVPVQAASTRFGESASLLIFLLKA